MSRQPSDDVVSRSALRRRVIKNFSNVVRDMNDYINQAETTIEECLHPVDSFEQADSQNVMDDEDVEVFGTSCSFELNNETLFEYEIPDWPIYDPRPLSDSDDDDDVTVDDDLGEQLTNWSLQFGISLVAFTALLSMLRMYFPNLPKDARTLLKTNTKYTVKELAGGLYHHFGILPSIEKTLRRFTTSIIDGSCLKLQINIDGLPLFKSSNVQLWPILGLIMSVKMKEPVVIGVYSGNKKPSSSIEYLDEFVKDVKTLEAGFTFEGKQLSLQLSSVICDTPARSFVKNIKSHNGYYGCDKCSQSGLYINHRMTYPDNDSLLWTDESFLSDLAEDHRAPNWTNPFPGITVGFISQFPVDYMHLVCLGVVRRLLNIWLKGKLKTRLTNRLVDQLSTALVQLRSHIPSEFARKPRSVREVDRWKATEFRQFLLYTGPVVLSSIVDEPVYQNFMLLSAGISILICPSLSVIYADYAMSLLKDFVMHYGQIYGKDLIVYNVHGIIHLAEDVKRHGHLDKYSSFPYENHLQKLKKMVRKPKYPLAQIIRRLSEKESATKPTTPCTNFKKEHCKGPVPVELNALKQFEEMQTENFVIKLTKGDNIFLIGDYVCVIINIVQCTDFVYVVYQPYQRKTDFFEYPFKSTFLGICAVSGLDTEYCYSKISDISCKCVGLPYEEQFVVFPILHTRA